METPFRTVSELTGPLLFRGVTAEMDATPAHWQVVIIDRQRAAVGAASGSPSWMPAAYGRQSDADACATASGRRLPADRWAPLRLMAPRHTARRGRWGAPPPLHATRPPLPPTTPRCSPWPTLHQPQATGLDAAGWAPSLLSYTPPNSMPPALLQVPTSDPTPRYTAQVRLRGSGSALLRRETVFSLGRQFPV